jgi:lipooligosaccharide transport system permease protein
MTLLLRVAPPMLLGRRATRIVERNLLVYRRTWLVIVSGFFEPLFYLLSIGFGLGVLVGAIPGPDGRPIPYTAFVAPALLASSAMNGAIYDSTMNIFFKLKYAKTYDAILATPVGVPDVAVGEVLWALLRGTMYATAFMVVMLAMGLALSPTALLALPAALLIGFAFAGVGMAVTTWVRSWQDFELIQLCILPLFLFSATFYPITTYPEPVRTLVSLTPLYQGVDLVRGLTTGVLQPVLLLHVAYLALMGTAGLLVVRRRLDKLLLT